MVGVQTNLVWSREENIGRSLGEKQTQSRLMMAGMRNKPCRDKYDCVQVGEGKKLCKDSLEFMEHAMLKCKSVHARGERNKPPHSPPAQFLATHSLKGLSKIELWPRAVCARHNKGRGAKVGSGA